MKKLLLFLSTSFTRFTSSIAFIPGLFAISGLALAFLTVTIEYEPLVIDIKEDVEFLLIASKEDGRLILGTLVGSTISLMVFSFSMVMIVLNRASSSLSPRILPGLISNKFHQVILGVYLGTILYSLIMIVNFQNDEDHVLPTLGILVSMILGITCLWLFVFFIHSISKSLQVESILENIYKNTLLQLEKVETTENQQQELIPKSDKWIDVCVDKAGYLKQFQTKNLLQISAKHDFQMTFRKHIGAFIVRDYPLIKVSKKLSPEILEELKSCFTFYPDDQVKDHYLFGFKQISEVAVKSLSPGINDPGTALKALDLLSVLFIKRMKIRENDFVHDDNNKVRIVFNPLSFDELLFYNLIPIREYGKADVLVTLKILEVLKNMLYADTEREYSETLIKVIQSCLEAADYNLKNSLDREQINLFVQSIEALTNPSHSLSYLSP